MGKKRKTRTHPNFSNYLNLYSLPQQDVVVDGYGAEGLNIGSEAAISTTPELSPAPVAQSCPNPGTASLNTVNDSSSDDNGITTRSQTFQVGAAVNPGFTYEIIHLYSQQPFSVVAVDGDTKNTIAAKLGQAIQNYFRYDSAGVTVYYTNDIIVLSSQYQQGYTGGFYARSGGSCSATAPQSDTPVVNDSVGSGGPAIQIATSPEEIYDPPSGSTIVKDTGGSATAVQAAAEQPITTDSTHDLDTATTENPDTKTKEETPVKNGNLFSVIFPGVDLGFGKGGGGGGGGGSETPLTEKEKRRNFFWLVVAVAATVALFWDDRNMAGGDM